MNDLTQTPGKRRRRGAGAGRPTPEAAPSAARADHEVSAAANGADGHDSARPPSAPPKPAAKTRPTTKQAHKRKPGSKPSQPGAAAQPAASATDGSATIVEKTADAPIDDVASTTQHVDNDTAAPGAEVANLSIHDAHDDPTPHDHEPNDAHGGPAGGGRDRVDDGDRGGQSSPSRQTHEPTHHRWVYAALAAFMLALSFGAWGVWTTWFAGGGKAENLADLRRQHERLTQEVSTLQRSDQISREANRDLQRTLAERDEEIAGLRADVAFYERFVGATGQRRGLSVHDLEMAPQNGDVWHFVATLTQNLNRGAVNNGRLTLSIEGTRQDKLERLSWSSLRKQNNSPGLTYSFKYFQQLEGEVMLPADFKPLRISVRLVPQGAAAVEQSFPWPETLDRRAREG